MCVRLGPGGIIRPAVAEFGVWQWTGTVATRGSVDPRAERGVSEPDLPFPTKGRW